MATTTTAEAKLAAMGMRILAFNALGFPINEAMDAVAGAGTFKALASSVYDELRTMKAEG